MSALSARWALAGVGALLASVLLGPVVAAQTIQAPTILETVFPLDQGGTMRYAIALPAGYETSRDEPRPLVLALHPGGRDAYYGSWFMQSIVEPALRGWEAVIVAPDVPDESWATEQSERAVFALLDAVLADHAIDRDRILVTGFSMGGRGTWYMSARNPDRFTGVIVMATGPGRESLENLERMPLYIIHSPEDEVVSYQPVEELAVELAGRGYPVQMMRLPGATHGMMGDYVGPLRAAGEWIRSQWSDRQTTGEIR